MLRRLHFWLLVTLTLLSFGGLAVSINASVAETGTMLELLDSQQPANLNQFEQRGPRQYLATPTTVPSPQMTRALENPVAGKSVVKNPGWLPQTGASFQFLAVLVGAIGLLGIWFVSLLKRQRKE